MEFGNGLAHAFHGLGGGAWRRSIAGLSCVAALSLGCQSTDSGDDSDGARGNLLLADENNYTSTSSLTIPTLETASATDLDICWTDVIEDIQCHDVAPLTDIDNVALLRFLNLSEEQVEDRLTAGQLAQSEIDGYLDFHTDHRSTCTKLSSMAFFETEIDIQEEYVESADNTYMLLFAKGTTPGVGARSMLFVKPLESSSNTRVDGASGCGFLDFSADLSTLQPLSVAADGPWVIDWRDIERDSQGHDVVFEAIDGVLLGFYANMTVAEIQSQILDLELIATSLWEMDLSGGRTANLARARARDGGAAFDGFDQSEPGVWLLGLMCSTCQNPAPIVLTVLEPAAGER